MESLDVHVAQLGVEGPFNDIYYAEGNDFHDLLRKIALYAKRSTKILLSTEKPLLYYDMIYRAMLKTCDLFLQQYANQLKRVHASLRKFSNSILLHLNLGLLELLQMLSDNFN